MANYALIENNVICELHETLPINWRHISGLHLSEHNIEYLKSVGWYKIIKQIVPYDPETEHISDYEYRLENNEVFEYPIISAGAQRNINSPIEITQETFDYILFKIRERRNELLSATDYIELPSIKQIKGEEFVNNYLSYRQELRELPNKILNNEVDINNIVWPVKP